MGKRKKAAKPPPKPKSAKLDVVFDCLFCGHEATCECFIDKSIRCRVCGAQHTSKVNVLEEAVDVYANWIDANAKENQEEPPERRAEEPPQEERTASRSAAAAGDDEEQNDDYDDGDDDVADD